MLRIAICGDEEYFRLLEKELIEKYMEGQGYECIIDSYSSGEEMLSGGKEGESGKPEALPYDIIILDVSMGEMDGIETARRIRQRNEKVKSEMAMYRSISEHLDKQRKRTHEYKNQIAAISALAAAKQYGKLGAYLEKIDTNLKISGDAIDTNHVIVNAILNTKYREAVDKGVSFVLKINDLSGLHMEEEDIVVICFNLLDNAIEACSQRGPCNHSEGKVVKFKFVLEEGRIVIAIKNSMERKPILKNGKFVTSKMKEANEHGFGIRNVMETVEKYGGQYAVDSGGGWFSFTILIRNPVA